MHFGGILCLIQNLPTVNMCTEIFNKNVCVDKSIRSGKGFPDQLFPSKMESVTESCPLLQDGLDPQPLELELPLTSNVQDLAFQPRHCEYSILNKWKHPVICAQRVSSNSHEDRLARLECGVLCGYEIHPLQNANTKTMHHLRKLQFFSPKTPTLQNWKVFS